MPLNADALSMFPHEREHVETREAASNPDYCPHPPLDLPDRAVSFVAEQQRPSSQFSIRDVFMARYARVQTRP
jgi:hypothetical protein